MTRGTGSIDFYQERVLVAVIQDLMHALNIAGGFALLPEFLAGAAPEPGDTRFYRLAQ